MDQRPLEPGEVRFEATGTPPPTEPSPRELPGKWAIGGFVAFFLVMMWVSHRYPNSTEKPAAVESVQVPAAPTPPGAYAVVTPHGSAAQGGAVGFVHERLVILRVPPNEIPEEDRVRAAVREREPSDRVVTEGVPGGRSLAVASRFAVGLAALVRPGSARHVEAATLPPYILHGDVDITCGDLTNDDAGYAALLLEDGELTRASISLAEGPARGPPVRARTVYIMGNVREVHGPEQYRQSVLLEKTLELGPTDSSREAYKERLGEWNKEILALEAKLHVPAEDLRAYAGTMVQVKSGEIVGAVDRNGKPVPEPGEIRLRNQVNRAEHHLSPEPEGREGHVSERPMELHLP